MAIQFALVFAFAADHSRATAELASAADTREAIAARSGYSRTCRAATVSFQRLLARFPPVISAGIRHKLLYLKADRCFSLVA